MTDNREQTGQKPDFRHIYAEGWRVHIGGEVVGPVSLGNLLAWFGAGEISATDLVWHDRTGAWHPLRTVLQVMTGANTPPETPAVDPAILQSLGRIRSAPVRNPLYLAATGMLALFFLFFLSSSIGLLDGDLAAIIFLGIDLYLCWWAWLEWKGLTITGDAISFPARIPFWPYFVPYKMTQASLSEVEQVRYGKTSGYALSLDLKTPKRDHRLVFDSPATREMVAALLALRQITIVQQ
ncbi:MAG: DUF4339 domain-containing protein [Hyphomicrobiales bacterium]|nr:DUF4339 domain-containing protein [Hyphomicrobiales bacterium]